MPHKKSHRYDDFPTSCSSSKSTSKHYKSISSNSCYPSSSSCYSSSSSCYLSSSSCKRGKCKCNPYMRCNPYANPCNPCNPSNPYYPTGCPNPYVNPCPNSCYNGNPCPPGPCTIPCGPTPCNPCLPSPCNSIKTYNPFLYPNYTVYEITTTSYTIPSTACSTYYLYTVVGGSSPSSTITLPQIASLDCGKKRNFVITNKGGSTVFIIPGGSDTINGVAGTYSLLPYSSITLYSDTVSNWTAVGSAVPV